MLQLMGAGPVGWVSCVSRVRGAYLESPCRAAVVLILRYDPRHAHGSRQPTGSEGRKEKEGRESHTNIHTVIAYNMHGNGSMGSMGGTSLGWIAVACMAASP
jgi:hypothetical protein